LKWAVKAAYGGGAREDADRTLPVAGLLWLGVIQTAKAGVSSDK
jgi:hypothetical protein